VFVSILAIVASVLALIVSGAAMMRSPSTPPAAVAAPDLSPNVTALNASLLAGLEELRLNLSALWTLVNGISTSGGGGGGSLEGITSSGGDIVLDASNSVTIKVGFGGAKPVRWQISPVGVCLTDRRQRQAHVRGVWQPQPLLGHCPPQLLDRTRARRDAAQGLRRVDGRVLAAGVLQPVHGTAVPANQLDLGWIPPGVFT
jgi:hypothetical protein